MQADFEMTKRRQRISSAKKPETNYSSECIL